MGAVLANAVFDAVGVRLYRLPMTPQRILAALARP
jgi:CO/xanthine dehydrogenase Mo-binding subunit